MLRNIPYFYGMTQLPDSKIAQRPLTDLSIIEIAGMLKTFKEPAFRASQIINWLYDKRVNHIDEMLNLSKAFRQKMADSYYIKKLQIHEVKESANNDAVKFAFRTGKNDTDIIESVILADGNRRTACVSSQLGCALGCVYCKTGTMGFIRNLAQYEILGQLIAMNDWLSIKDGSRISNIVFMGMGEALSNFDTFVSSMEIIRHAECFNIGRQRITVSTAGVVPSIQKLGESGLDVGLAISLNTYNDERRNTIMPVNKKWPIATLIQAARAYHRKTHADITFEYVVVENENDTPEAVMVLSDLLGGLVCKINLIPLNPSDPSLAMSEPGEDRLNEFGRSLADNGLTVTVRKSRGRDIDGACGQLAGSSMEPVVDL
jgi:23S rRNA (adenine2503-C2)-methyltransferase